MVVKLLGYYNVEKVGLRVVLSHMVVKPEACLGRRHERLRVVLSHMVVKPV